MATKADREDFLHMLENARLQFVEKLIASDKAFTDDDFRKLALYREAIKSTRDAITFAESLGG
jgi:hypothetical protein